MSISIKVLFIIYLFPIISFAQTKKDYKRFNDSLMTSNNKGKYITYFTNELKINPKNEEVLRILGFYYIAQQKLDLGEKYYRQAIGANPKCAKCYMNLSRIYGMRKDNSKATEYIDKGISTDPNNAMLYANKAVLSEAKGDAIDALFSYNKAIALDTANAGYYLLRGRYNLNHGYTSLALSDINKAIALAPDSYEPLQQRALLYYNLQKFKESTDDMNRAIYLDSTIASLYTSRGAIYQSEKKYSWALSDYAKAIQLNPKDYLPYYNRSLCDYQAEDMDGFCSDTHTCYEVLKKYNPELDSLVKDLEYTISAYCDNSIPNYYIQRGVALYNKMNYAQAVNVYNEGLKKFPDNSLMLSFCGNAYLAQNQFQNALLRYYAALKNKGNVLQEYIINKKHSGILGDSTIFLQNFLGDIKISIAESKFGLGLYDEAITAINEAISETPPVTSYGPERGYFTRGNFYFALEKYDQALQDYNKCIELNPYYTSAYINSALVKLNKSSQVKMVSFNITGKDPQSFFNTTWFSPSYMLKKNSDNSVNEALQECDRAIAIDPKYSYAYYIRGQIKRSFNYPDYCTDLVKAKELGYIVEEELLKSCNQ